MSGLFEDILNERSQPVLNQATPKSETTDLFDDILQPKVLEGSVKKEERTYSSRFPDRKTGVGGFFSNAGNDIKDSVQGLAQIVGNVGYYTVGRPLMRIAKGETPLQRQDINEAKEAIKNTPQTLKAFGEGLKENYGQGGLDMVNWQNLKGHKSPINVDIPGLVQSFHAHPLNLLDLVGIGEVGKIKQVSNLTKGGQVSDFAKTVGNKNLNPKYSENLVLNAGQRIAEAKPFQNIVNALDNSPFRGTTDIVADFLGLNPESRLMGAKGAQVRQAKLIEQKHQTKNINERNKAIAENNTALSGLTDAEAKALVKGVESADIDSLKMLSENNPRVDIVKENLRKKSTENSEFYKNAGLLSEETINNLPINTYASIKFNKPIDSLSDIEKLDAIKDIQKLPDTQKPFYIPMMFDDKLRAGDFFANTTKYYNPSELKHRSIGMGLDANKTSGKRVYDPIELANRLDAHRIKMINTENMINEIIDSFAKPFDLSKEKVLEGYVPFNPDAFLKFYKQSINLNELTLRKLNELDNIDDVLKSCVQQAIHSLPDDIKQVTGAIKNNKIYQLPKDVAETLMSGKNKKGIWEAMFDMGTAGFKRKVLGLSPKWFINNRIGNGIMAGLKGVGIEDYVKAFNLADDFLPETLKSKSMYEAEKTIIGRTGGGNNSTFGNVTRLLGGEFIDTSDLKGLQKAQMNAANALALPGKTINSITDAIFSFNQKFEDLERKAAYLHSVDTVGKKMLKTAGQNITKQEILLKEVLKDENILNHVIKNVDDTLGDYINMTATERRVIRKIVPFYSWLRTITRYTLSLAETNPFRADLANKISMVLAEENNNLPEYQRGSVTTEFNSDITGKPLRLNYEHSIPFSTFGDTVDNPVGLINPLITQTLESVRGKREFMNKPFVSPNYENIFPNGYASLTPEARGEFMQELPVSERIKSLPIGIARTTIPGLDWTERVALGTLMNLMKGEFKPYDALFDTSFGGYNYRDVFSKRPKGWSNNEQLLRLLLPLQQEGHVKSKVKVRRNIQ